MYRDTEVRIASNILEALYWDMDASVLVDAMVEQLGVDEILDNMKESDIIEWLGALKPEEVFEHEDLAEWAHENMEPQDPLGYEERERY